MAQVAYSGDDRMEIRTLRSLKTVTYRFWFSLTLSVNRKEQEERAKAETLDQIRLEQAVKQQEEEKQRQHAQE